MTRRWKTILNVLLILVVLSFFVTPLSHYSKIVLNRIFSFSPEVIEEENRNKILDYDWKLKDPQWEFFNFEKSKGKVVFINFWASWKLPSEAELSGIQKLYNSYKDQVDFYIITNELRPPVEEFVEKNEFTFPVTYLIIGEKMPVDSENVPSSYLIDKEGNIVIHRVGISDWDSPTVYNTIDRLLQE